jgi:hypothetical protein
MTFFLAFSWMAVANESFMGTMKVKCSTGINHKHVYTFLSMKYCLYCVSTIMKHCYATKLCSIYDTYITYRIGTYLISFS